MLPLFIPNKAVFHLTRRFPLFFLRVFISCLLFWIVFWKANLCKHLTNNNMSKSGGRKGGRNKWELLVPLCASNTEDSFHMVSASVETRGVRILAYIKYLLVLVKFLLRPWPGGPIWMTTSVIREWINRNAFYKVVFLLADSKLKCCIIHWSSILGHFLQRRERY